MQSWIDGRTWPDAAELVELARATNKPLSYFFPADFDVPPDVRAALTPHRIQGLNITTGMPLDRLHKIARGEATPSAEELDAILNPRDYQDGEKGLPGAPQPAPIVSNIPVLDIRPSAGPGRVADVVRATENLPLPGQFVSKIAPPGAQLACMRCAGDSMEPTIRDGAILIIDERQREPRPWKPPGRKLRRLPTPDDDIFVFYHSEDLRLKRLRHLGDGFLAILSDNHDGNPPEIIKPGRDGSIRVIGKVVWWDNRL